MQLVSCGHASDKRIPDTHVSQMRFNIVDNGISEESSSSGIGGPIRLKNRMELSHLACGPICILLTLYIRVQD